AQAPRAVHVNRLDGRIALVTGAGSGIGRATAVRLAAEGASVACLDVVADACEATTEAIVSDGAKAQAWRCDVSDPADVERVVAEAAAAFGTLDVVCNVAGIGKFANTHEQPVGDWDRIIAVNLTGTFLVCRATLPPLPAG